ncbi:radical SAM protein [Ancylobacter terrae]|uniref:radical SAM protein n=1 Tax=Ancylobacter sp. sgz301288 TaxID=3342077 RepID=UPI00385DAA99
MIDLLDERPRLDPAVAYFAREERHLFFNTALPDWIVVSANAAYALSRFDGERTVREVAGGLAALGSTVDEAGVAALAAFARDRGILALGAAAPARAALRAQTLGSIYLKITNRCDLECAYCYASSGPEKGAGELDTDEWKALITEFAAIARPGSRMTFTGGEPMIRRDLEELARFARAQGFGTGLITNGGLIRDEASARRLGQVFDTVQISLDGTEATHDRNRGRGAWGRARAGLRHLEAAGVEYYASATITADNRAEMADLVAEFGPRLRTGGVLNTGRARSKDFPRLGNTDYVKTIRDAGAVGFFEDPSFIEHSRRAPRGHCGASTTTLSVDERGNIFPCQILISREMSAGNVRAGGVADLLAQPVWSELRGGTVDADSALGCSSCMVRYICGGGCRAKVYYETQQFRGPDGLCAMWRESIVNGLFKTAELPGSRSLFVS